jgi:MFS family permease
MGVEDEYSGRTRKVKSKGVKPYLPIMGLVLAIAFGAIGYIIGPKLAEVASKQFNFELTTQIEWVFRGAVFLIGLGIAAIAIGAATPKPKTEKLATERNLAKERAQRRKEHVASKKRQREINRRMAEDVKRKSGR